MSKKTCVYPKIHEEFGEYLRSLIEPMHWAEDIFFMGDLEDEYQKFIVKHRRLKDPEKQLQEILLGLASEVGEVLDVYKKQLRDNKWDEAQFRKKVKDELGDLFHYLFSLLEVENIELREIIEDNIKKIEERYQDE
jgi:NTP pyrophosphatase (non-canonical NTP hydrolase)